MLPKLLACLEDLKLLASDSLQKDCLIHDELANPNCPAPLAETLNKESQTLVLEGNVVEQYTSGTTISLQDANGNICGSATVAEAETPAVYNAETDQTTITITECELQEGKTPAQVTQAKPVLASTATAVKSVVKQVSMLSLKKSVARKEAVKKEEAPVIERG